MKPYLQRLFALFLRSLLWLRYKVTYKGLEHLKTASFPRSGGILFMPNHPSILVDPLVVSLPLYPHFTPRPLITEYLYFSPGVYQMMKWVNALPIPDFENCPNSVKRRRNEEVFQEVLERVDKGDNFIIYPAGRTKQTGLEIIGGASGVHTILSKTQANVCLVRITGLWGSMFSRALTGKAPPLWKTLKRGVGMLLKNFIFFMPRRSITVEYVPAPADFPYEASRKEMNRWLERWYNHVPGVSDEKEEFKGEPFIRVSYSRWSEEYLEVNKPPPIQPTHFDIKLVPESIKQKVYGFLSELSKRPVDELDSKLSLSEDLALDSLDAAEIIAFLEEKYDVRGVSPVDLTSVGTLLGIASGQIVPEREFESKDFDEKTWFESKDRPMVQVPQGVTLPEVFIRSCKRMGNIPACADASSGVLSYKDLLLRVLLLADKFKSLPGDHVGVLLPASVGANVVILALQTAGKVPVMINWTVGRRHLKSVIDLSGIQQTLTSWSFINRLENADLTGIDEQLVFLEDLRYEIGLLDKIHAYLRSKKPTQVILRNFGIHRLSESDRAVLLFTSGTEKAPKGVPLSHGNLLSNQRGTMPMIRLNPDDVLLAMLPPFHSFGFTLTGLLPLLAGVKVVYSPNPTDGQRVAHDVGKWGASLVVGAPSFLRRVFQAASEEQLRRVRLVVSGAERSPPDLREMVQSMGNHVGYMEGYGVTECSPFVTAQCLDEGDVGVGRTGPDWEICVVDQETHEPMVKGERGLVLVKGPIVFEGYVTDQEVETPFVEVRGENWYNTGDLGFIDEKGCLNLAGRLKRFVKIGGEMISLAAIESALLEQAPKRGWVVSHEGPTIAVCAKESESHKTELHLFTISKSSVDDVNAALRASGFSNLARIQAVHEMEEIPVMGTGKTNYRAMEERYLC